MKEAQSGDIDGHTQMLERALGGCPRGHFRAARHYGNPYRWQARWCLLFSCLLKHYE